MYYFNYKFSALGSSFLTIRIYNMMCFREKIVTACKPVERARAIVECQLTAGTIQTSSGRSTASHRPFPRRLLHFPRCLALSGSVKKNFRNGS
jgi:hypothetical protein